MMQVNSGGAEIAYDDFGSGETLVLLHGFPLARAMWDNVQSLLVTRFRVVRVDLRGMGASQIAGGPYLMETLAGDVAGVLDALGIARATICGHSLGGYVALAFARMYLERVSALALVSSRFDADDLPIARAREALADQIERDATMQPVIDGYLPRLLAPDTFAQRPDIVARARRIALATDPCGAAAMLRGMAQRVDANDIAEEIAVPTFVIAGRHDAVIDAAEVERIARAFAQGSLHWCDRSGHTAPLEEPERTAELLARLVLLGSDS